MKKIFCYIITVVMIVCLLAVPVFATEDGSAQGASEEVRVKSEEAVGAETETEAVSAAETVLEDATEQEDTVKEVDGSSGTPISTESETEDLAAIIGNAGSRLEAIVGIAGAMGVTLEEAEALLDKMVAIGDEHFGESDFWAGIKTSILGNPESWTVVALVVLMFVALVVFLIRGLIKNTTAQAATKANIIDIKKNEAEISDKVSKANLRLGDIEREHSDIKLEMDEIREMAISMLKVVDDSKQEVDRICEMAIAMLAAVDSLKSNSESALKVNEEQALQTVQLLNIAMGRQLPRVSESTRKVWYDDAVSKIKEAAGVKEQTNAEQ